MGLPRWIQPIKCFTVFFLSLTAAVFAVGIFDDTPVNAGLPDFISYKRRLRVAQGIIAWMVSGGFSFGEKASKSWYGIEI
jgi:hypothetical protein